MKLIVSKKNESYCSLSGDEIVLRTVYNYFVFKPDNYQFTPSYKLGKWDGKIRLYDIHKNLFPLGLVFKLAAFCKVQGIDIEYENFGINNTIINEDFLETYCNENLKLSFPLRDYQINGVITGINEKHCILLSPTGTGKSAMIYVIMRLIMKFNNNFKLLIIVPTISLVDQMVGDFDDYSHNTGKEYSNYCQKIYDGSKKDVEKQIVVSTYQSLQNLPAEYFRQFSALLVDECHTGSVKGNVINKIVCNCINAKYKIGFSGTLQDSKMNVFSLNSLYGKVYQLTQTKKEIDRGNLSNIKIYQVYLHYPENDAIEFFSKIKKLKQSIAINNLSKSTIYQEEVSFVNNKEYKRNFICAICRKQKKNTLILFKRNEQFGYKLFSKMKKEFLDRKVFLITGATEKDDREKVRKICETVNNAIIIASYKIFSTGINIKNLHNIIFGESIKSKITTLQSIGRSLRLNANKDYAQIFDLVDSIIYNDYSNIMLKHAFSRLDIYDKENFEVVKKDINSTEYM